MPMKMNTHKDLCAKMLWQHEYVYTFLRHCAYTHLVIVTALQCKLQLLNIASQVSQMPRAPAPERGMHALTMGENGSSCSSE